MFSLFSVTNVLFLQFCQMFSEIHKHFKIWIKKSHRPPCGRWDVWQPQEPSQPGTNYFLINKSFFIRKTHHFFDHKLFFRRKDQVHQSNLNKTAPLGKSNREQVRMLQRMHEDRLRCARDWDSQLAVEEQFPQRKVSGI